MTSLEPEPDTGPAKLVVPNDIIMSMTSSGNQGIIAPVGQLMAETEPAVYQQIARSSNVQIENAESELISTPGDASIEHQADQAFGIVTLWLNEQNER